MNLRKSIVEYLGEQQGNSCGYCKNTDFNKFSSGIWAHQLTVEDYNRLLDRGWRRSGQYVYKPALDRTCCQQYTLRCNALAFCPSKNQKRVMNKMRDYLVHGRKSLRPVVEYCNSHKICDIASSCPTRMAIPSDIPIAVDSASVNAKDNESKEAEKRILKNDTANAKSINVNPLTGHQCHSHKKKVMRRERAFARLAKKGISIEMAKTMKEAKTPKPKPLEDRLAVGPVDGHQLAHKLELKIVRSHPPDSSFSSSFQESHRLYWTYQTVVHGDPANKPSEKQYRRFLCTSPLLDQGAEIPTDDHLGFGSFHQQYFLDGKLVAVGVIDVLPRCVSSKYFYYDPDYQFLSLGTYSALMYRIMGKSSVVSSHFYFSEIALVRKLAKIDAALSWYYMGFYIHSCPKMSYKSRFRSSELLCPESYLWVPIQKCLLKLDRSSYSRFDETGADDVDGKSADLDQVTVLLEGRGVGNYGLLRRIKGRNCDDQDDQVLEYARLVGRKCADRMLLLRSG